MPQFHAPAVPAGIGLPSVLALLLIILLACGQTALVKTEPDVPYLPTPHETVIEMLRTAGVTADDIVYDLGCGDGRIPITAAMRFGARAVGVEIDPRLIAVSRKNAEKAGLYDRVTFRQEDIFRTDIKDASVVTLYLLPGLNTLLIPKLLAELKPGSRVVSHMHDMGAWPSDRSHRYGNSTIYLWVIPADVHGAWHFRISGSQSDETGTLSIRQSFQDIAVTVRVQGKKARVNGARLEAGRINFSTAQQAGGKEIRHFSGSVENDEIAGMVTVTGGSHPGTFRWVATRDGETRR
jgi:precorrin-6B methylase 2